MDPAERDRPRGGIHGSARSEQASRRGRPDPLSAVRAPGKDRPRGRHREDGRARACPERSHDPCRGRANDTTRTARPPRRRTESGADPRRGARPTRPIVPRRLIVADASSGKAPECPRQESNLRTRFRKPMLYPLSYGGEAALRSVRSRIVAMAPRRSSDLGDVEAGLAGTGRSRPPSDAEFRRCPGREDRITAADTETGTGDRERRGDHAPIDQGADRQAGSRPDAPSDAAGRSPVRSLTSAHAQTSGR
jgi:hypothetical protein